MPVFDFIQWTQQTGGTLEKDGPIIQVEVSMPPALEEWFVQNKLPVAAPITGYALIDTGASISGIHEPVLNQLSIVPIDSIPVANTAGPGRAFVYPTRVSFPGLGVSDWPLSRVVGNQLNWQTSDGKNVIMLVGRDILKYFLMIYNGKFNGITLSY